MEEIDVFCSYLTRVAGEMISGGPLRALVQADDDERIFLTALMPEEFSVTVELPAGNALSAIADALYLVQDFALNHYRENLFTDMSWEKFAALPGVFEFLSEDALPLCCRLVQWRVTERFGRRFLKSIDLYEDAVQIHMLGGNYMVEIMNFPKNLERELNHMALLIRKPIRKRYDKQS